MCGPGGASRDCILEGPLLGLQTGQSCAKPCTLCYHTCQGRKGWSQWWRHEQGHVWWSAHHQVGLPAHCLWEACQLPPTAAPGQP